MMINKLKAVSIAICCLIVALWSETQGMEKRTDLLEPPIVKVGRTIQLSDQHVSDELTSDPILAPLVNLEGITTSWPSYLLSPANTVIQSTREAMNYANKNPRMAGFIALYFTCRAVAALPSLACMAYVSVEAPQLPQAYSTQMVAVTMGSCETCVPLMRAWWANLTIPPGFQAALLGYSCAPMIPWEGARGDG